MIAGNLVTRQRRHRLGVHASRMKQIRNNYGSERTPLRKPRSSNPTAVERYTNFAHQLVESAERIRRNRPSRCVPAPPLPRKFKHPVDDTKDGDGAYKLPKEMHNIFVISIRPQRWEDFQIRVGPWKKYATLFTGTDGRKINKRRFILDGKLHHKRNGLRRGEIGCYDAHVRLWKEIVKKKIPYAFICEDDADIKHDLKVSKTIQKAFAEVKEMKLDYDLFYVGHRAHGIRKRLSPMISEPKGGYGLFAYVLTLAGAKKLIRAAFPAREAVDMFVSTMQNRKLIKCIALDPSLCYVVPVPSDTAMIR